jgi:hypothetical protein
VEGNDCDQCIGEIEKTREKLWSGPLPLGREAKQELLTTITTYNIIFEHPVAFIYTLLHSILQFLMQL